MPSPKCALLIVKDVWSWLLTPTQAQRREHIFIPQFSSTKVFTWYIFWLSISRFTWFVGGPSVHFTPRQKGVDRKYFQNFSSTLIRRKWGIYQCTSRKSWSWLKSVYPLPPTCKILYSSLNSCSKLKLKWNRDLIRIYQGISISTLLRFNARAYFPYFRAQTQ